MGIAADDVFLMYNAYQLAARVVGNADPKEKMKWAFKELWILHGFSGSLEFCECAHHISICDFGE